MKNSRVLFALLAITTIFSLNLVLPTYAYEGGLFVASPHPYTDKWQNMKIGAVILSNVGTTLYVRYFIYSAENWEITETHVHAALDPEEIPHTKSGNPKVGKFAYQMDHDPAVKEYLYRIDLGPEAVPGTKVYIAAHAVVRNGCQEETAWANCMGEEYTFAVNQNQMLIVNSRENDVVHMEPVFISTGSWYHFSIIFNKNNSLLSIFCNERKVFTIKIANYFAYDNLVLHFQNEKPKGTFTIDFY